MSDLHKVLPSGTKICISKGWYDAGKTGYIIGVPIFVKQWWYPILWGNEEDPEFHKADGIEIVV